MRAAAPLYTEASMPLVLVSLAPETVGLPDPELPTVCATVASELSRGISVLDYLHRVRPTRRTALIEDREGGETSWDLAGRLRESPPNEGTATVHPVAEDEDDFRPAVDAALTARAQAAVYTGTSPIRPALCARALSGAGFTGPRMGFEFVMRPAFLKEAGETAEGWLFEAPHTDPAATQTKAAKAFTAAHRERYDEPPRPLGRRGLRRRRPDRPRHGLSRHGLGVRTRRGRRTPLPHYPPRGGQADPVRRGQHPLPGSGEHELPEPGHRRRLPLPGAARQIHGKEG
ncbi:hypothetical protein L3078_06560 [Streptomyces deccanensis]|nr:hypothetical protein L3078_06560 [Streptomyces deccanensis]